jgi:glutaminyl-tRNA synthetase
VDVAQLEFSIRDDLNKKVPRVMCVVNPLKVTIENYDGSEEIDAPYYPSDVAKDGSRKLPFGKEIYIDKDDFSLNPPKGYYRLTPEQPVRLKYAYIISFKEAITDENGEIVEIKATYHPNSKSGEDTSGIKVKSAIQWVEANSAKSVELRIYDRLFKNEAPQGIEDLNPNSLKIVKDALIEPSVISDKPDVRFQFEREGYFYAEPVDYSDKNPVFNKIVSLKDSWGKKKESKPRRGKTENKKVQIDGEVTPMTAKQQALFDIYTKEHKLNLEVANTLARDAKLSNFYQEAIKESNSYTHIANLVANLVANDVARELKTKDIQELNFTPAYIAQLSSMIDDETISTKIAKQVYEEMLKSGDEPKTIVESKGLIQISDPVVIQPLIDEVIQNNPENVAKFKDGNTKLLGFFVGQVLKATKGKGNPKVVNELVAKALS